MKKFKVGETVLVEAVIDDTYAGNNEYNIRLKGYETESFRVKKVYPLSTTNKTYENGMNDAWKMAIRISEMETSHVEALFGDYYTMDEIIEYFTASEVAAKIQAWEASKGIHYTSKIN